MFIPVKAGAILQRKSKSMFHNLYFYYRSENSNGKFAAFDKIICKAIKQPEGF